MYIASFLKDVLHYNGTNRTHIGIYKLKQSETCHKRAPKIKVCERSLPAGERASKIFCKQDTRNMWLKPKKITFNDLCKTSQYFGKLQAKENMEENYDPFKDHDIILASEKTLNMKYKCINSTLANCGC